MAPSVRDRWILHVDMDAFFAAVEALDDPSLAGRPLIVGGAGARGVVASCSYEARAFGVRSAMPSAVARRLCPEAVFVAGRYDRYADVSRRMHSVFESFTPVVEGISLDEAFLDVTGSVHLLGPPRQMAVDIRDRIGDELGLSCSVGAARVKFLAKLASEAAKPRVGGPGLPGTGRGVFVVERGRELEFLHPHPIGALWGVGPATAKRLAGLGFDTIGDLARVEPLVLERALGRAHGGQLARLARGLDDRPVEPHRPVKSISHEETYPTDRRDPDGLHVEVVRMADAVAARLRRSGLAGRTVTLKVRFGDFTTRTRSTTAGRPVDTGPGIAELAQAMLSGVELAGGVRLLGVGASNLVPAGDAPPEQLSLELLSEAGAASGVAASGVPARSTGPGPPDGPAAPGTSARSRTSDAVDAIRARYGAAAVGPAALVEAGRLRIRRTGDHQWGPSGPGGAAADPGTGRHPRAERDPRPGRDAGGSGDAGTGRPPAPER